MTKEKTLTARDIESEVAAIEADAGQVVPGLRESLAEAIVGSGRRTTPE